MDQVEIVQANVRNLVAALLAARTTEQNRRLQILRQFGPANRINNSNRNQRMTRQGTVITAVDRSWRKGGYLVSFSPNPFPALRNLTLP